MAAPCTSVCTPWATTEDLCAPCATYDMDSALMDQMLDVASDLLFQLSGRQFAGSCEDTVRPCARGHAEMYPTDSVLWTAGICTCESSRSCGCGGLSEITLGGFPVTSITQVRIDGAVLAASAYSIRDNRYLARIDGDAWPCCSDLTADPASDEDTFDVTFTYGVPPPFAGVLAASVLACELALACEPPAGVECRLPSRVREVQREGVSFLLQDPTTLLANGMTGIFEVDAFLRAYNPHRIQSRATVMYPGKRRRVHRVT